MAYPPGCFLFTLFESGLSVHRHASGTLVDDIMRSVYQGIRYSGVPSIVRVCAKRFHPHYSGHPHYIARTIEGTPLYRVLTVCSLYNLSISSMCSCEIRRQGACTAAVDCVSSFFYERTHRVSYQRDAHIHEILSSRHMFFK